MTWHKEAGSCPGPPCFCEWQRPVLGGRGSIKGGISRCLALLSVLVLLSVASCLCQLLDFTVNSLQLSSVAQSGPTLCDPMDCSTPGLPVHHQLLELTQTHVHQAGDAIQLSHPLSSPSPPTFSLSQHQGLFKWVSSSNQVAKGLEFQL